MKAKAKLSKADAAKRDALPLIQRKRVTKMEQSHGKLALGAVRPSDGSLTLEGVPHWMIGRTISGTWVEWPTPKGGAYGRTIRYRLHTDGRLCGHGWGHCGAADCAKLVADGKAQDEAFKRTRDAIAKQGGSPLMPGKAKTPKPKPSASRRPSTRTRKPAAEGETATAKPASKRPRKPVAA